jgi:hypothetical protein
MTKIYDVRPRDGVGPVCFGMSREAARAAMGGEPDVAVRLFPNQRYEKDCYLQGCFQIYYERDQPTVDFIELSSPLALVDPTFRGLSVFSTKADDVVEFVSKTDAYDKNDRELGYSFRFPSLDIAFWREALPEDDPEMEYFQTVAAGREGYFSRL